ncbi:hypothetical protein [Bosea sp. PAMC 26642]|uniref:hypothetical protein n=1 Tax=Bosea sp. (strain PAMC 26642) TaxID=1792307 RepID=UPI00076FE69F|nr:hypothetical protein [Bosea sp. PAMC 26642]AMJ59553.1 hypothetical protein AXW83_03860 [Bosea sp. PAMC 26642]
MNAFVAETTIRVERFTLLKLDRREWDGFAQTCDASFKCSAYNFASNLVQLLFGKRMFFVFYASTDGFETKIGQCALRFFKGAYHFEDRLQVLPDFDDYWTACMRALLTHIGSGRFYYGSLWSMDRDRRDQLERIEGTTLVDVTRFRVQYIDFAASSDWDHYAQSLHKNVQRNLKKAALENEAIYIESYRGPSAIKLLGKCSNLRKLVYDAKGIPFSTLRVLARAAFRILSFRHYAVSAAVIRGDRTVGVFSGVQFGRSTFYIDGGSLPGNRGLSWTLLITMIKAAYTAAPKGFFIFGWVLEGGNESKELIWSRQQCNIAERPSSLFEFAYEGR